MSKVNCPLCGGFFFTQTSAPGPGMGPPLSLVEAVRAMRAAQNRYFMTRDRDHLDEAKALEREVDKLIAPQKELFSG